MVDAVYFGSGVGNEQIKELGRLTVDEAEKHLKDLCYKYDVEDLLNKLGG